MKLKALDFQCRMISWGIMKSVDNEITNFVYEFRGKTTLYNNALIMMESCNANIIRRSIYNQCVDCILNG